MAGQALLSLSHNGIDVTGRIIGAAGPHSVLRSSPGAVEAFRSQVEILDMVGTGELEDIECLVT
jgi:tetrahydromethanopterin S-methyltransferase subunit A